MSTEGVGGQKKAKNLSTLFVNDLLDTLDSRQNVDLCPHICSIILFVQHFFARNHDQTEKNRYGKERCTFVSQNRVFSDLH